METLLFSLVPAIAWGVMWFFATKATRQLEVFQAQFLFQLAGIPMLLLLLPFVPLAPFPSGMGILLLIGLGVLISFTLTLYFHALKVGKLSVVGPLSNASGLVIVFLAVVFLNNTLYPLKIMGILSVLKEKLAPQQVVGSALILGGVISLNL
ncbi:MAG: EamA family transporter [Candidatus Dormibacteraceae bacterium]